MPRKHITVSGRVQGVGFRYQAQLLALSYHLTGWVENMDSGDVEIEIQGYQQDIDQFLFRLDKHSMFIRIDQMDIADIPELHESEFRVRY